jgi:hypothetical protein
MIWLVLWIGHEVARARERERERLWGPHGFDRVLVWCVALILAILGIVISPWLLWIGLFVVVPVVIAVASDD